MHTLSPLLTRRQAVAKATGLRDTGAPSIQYAVSGASLCPAHTQTTESGWGTLSIQRGLAPRGPENAGQ